MIGLLSWNVRLDCTPFFHSYIKLIWRILLACLHTWSIIGTLTCFWIGLSSHRFLFGFCLWNIFGLLIFLPYMYKSELALGKALTEDVYFALPLMFGNHNNKMHLILNLLSSKCWLRMIYWTNAPSNLHKYRLGCTSEFLIYGHVQQRRAVVETLRLAENEYQDGQDKIHKFEKTTGDCNAQTFKEKSKRWLIYVIQVHILLQLHSLCCYNFDLVKAPWGLWITLEYSYLLIYPQE